MEEQIKRTRGEWKSFILTITDHRTHGKEANDDYIELVSRYQQGSCHRQVYPPFQSEWRKGQLWRQSPSKKLRVVRYLHCLDTNRKNHDISLINLAFATIVCCTCNKTSPLFTKNMVRSRKSRIDLWRVANTRFPMLLVLSTSISHEVFPECLDQRRCIYQL